MNWSASKFGLSICISMYSRTFNTRKKKKRKQSTRYTYMYTNVYSHKDTMYILVNPKTKIEF